MSIKRKPRYAAPAQFKPFDRVRTIEITGVVVRIFDAGVMPKERAMIEVDGATGHARYQIIDLDKLEAVT